MIPARWASTRFPGKPLFDLLGKPLVQHVFERTKKCQLLDDIYLATDDERIAKAAEDFGAKVIMTSPEHPSGTDRLAEVATQLPSATHLINIQGDEPLIESKLIDELARHLKSDPLVEMVTAASSLSNVEQFQDPNIVKVVLSANDEALYFSRAPIPFPRGVQSEPAGLRHIGIYGYRRDTLLNFVSWPPSPLESIESLEQLRALSQGVKIKVIMTDHTAIGLDTPEQVPLLEQLLRNDKQNPI